MKSRIMPTDQYRLSMEARPLRVLYSKYNPSEISAPLQLVRPLGRIRKDKRQLGLPSDREKRSARRTGAREHVSCTRIDRGDLLDIDDVKMKPDQKNGHEAVRNCHQNAGKLDCYRESENASPIIGRSRTQDFEHKYKLAAARRSGQESPPPPPSRSHSVLNKKVIHLPLFTVNLKTYSGDTQVTQAVAQTRESLRRLMEIHRCKMKPASVKTANIRNYEFNAPTLSMSRTGSSTTISTASLQPFLAKPMFKSSSRAREKLANQTSFIHKQTNVSFDTREYTDSALVSSWPNKDEHDTKFSKTRLSDYGSDGNNGLEDSLWSIAIRPDTALTLGSTMNHIDRVIRSPTSDELKELSDVFKAEDVSTSWPNLDEIQRLRSSRSRSLTRRSKTSLSRPGTVQTRPGTVLNNVPESPEEVWTMLRNDGAYTSPVSTGSYAPPKPVLRYTSKPSTFKLDPIVVPSHTCTVCEMCNLYQRDAETSCPPNTPMSTQVADPMMFNEEPDQIVNTGSGRFRSVVKPEVMHISRINMNDGIYVTEEGTDAVKAKG